MVKEEDRMYYTMWGLVFVLGGLAAALWLSGQAPLGVLVFFGGLGVSMAVLGRRDEYQFYGGLGLIFLGAILYGGMAGLNMALIIVGAIIIIGLLFLWNALGGERR